METEYIDTKFDSLTNEDQTFKQICMEVINLEIEKTKKIETGNKTSWKLENNIWKNL